MTGYLATFLDFITYSYMIDNIILLITGTLHQRPISELVPKCHPLGSFEQVFTIKTGGEGGRIKSKKLTKTDFFEYTVECQNPEVRNPESAEIRILDVVRPQESGFQPIWMLLCYSPHIQTRQDVI